MPAPNQPICVAGYIRVSSRGQDYAYQRHAIERAARARGDVVHRWYGDVATGRTMQRPQLIKLRRHIADHQVQRLWVWRLDRLTRSGIVDTLSCINEIRGAGCQVLSVSDGLDLDGPAAELILAVLAWAAQLERVKIKENLDAARAKMASEGRAWGKPPLQPEIRALVLELAAARGEHGQSELSMARIARVVGISKSSVWNILHEERGPTLQKADAQPPQKTGTGQ